VSSAPFPHLDSIILHSGGPLLPACRIHPPYSGTMGWSVDMGSILRGLEFLTEYCLSSFGDRNVNRNYTVMT